MKYILLFLYAVLSVSGVVLFKIGSTVTLSIAVSRNVFSMQISWLSVLGLSCYVISFLMYMWMVSKNNISYLVPVASGIVYILTMLSSVLVLKEQVGKGQLLGISFILIGLLLMNLKLE